MENEYKQHIVNTGNFRIHFKETDNFSIIPVGGCQVFGQADTITDFVKSLDLENNWMPYKYKLTFVLRGENSKNMTAYLYRQ